MKNKLVAGLLAILVGGFGIHRFYLGQTGKGILYLLFFWTFIPFVIGVVDGILFLTMDDKEFDDLYNGGHPYNTTRPIFGGRPGMSYTEELERLHALKEKGIITEAEFQAKKAQLLR